MTTIDQLNARGEGYLPGLIGIEFLSMEPGQLTRRLALRALNCSLPTDTCTPRSSLPWQI